MKFVIMYCSSNRKLIQESMGLKTTKTNTQKTDPNQAKQARVTHLAKAVLS